MGGMTAQRETQAEPEPEPEPATTALLRCSFCGRGEADVRKLIAGMGGSLICDVCIAKCLAILDDDQATTRFSQPDLAQTQTLLDVLQGEGANEGVARDALRRIVNELRLRNVSWAVIGAAFGVSRQAAWDRFGKPPA